MGFRCRFSLKPIQWLEKFEFLWTFWTPFLKTHRIHGAGIYANIGGILMVNVTIYIYIIHGSYGKESKNPFGYPEFLDKPIWPRHQNMPKSVVPEGPYVLQICRWKGTRSPWSRWTFWCTIAAFLMHNCRWKRLFLDKNKRRCEVGELLSCYCCFMKKAFAWEAKYAGHLADSLMQPKPKKISPPFPYHGRSPSAFPFCDPVQLGSTSPNIAYPRFRLRVAWNDLETPQTWLMHCFAVLS